MALSLVLTCTAVTKYKVAPLHETYSVSRYLIVHDLEGVYVDSRLGIPAWSSANTFHEVTTFSTLNLANRCIDNFCYINRLTDFNLIYPAEIFVKPSEVYANGTCFISAKRADAIVTLRDLYADIVNGNIMIEDVWIDIYNIKKLCEEKGYK
jgi:hypothetical protein